MSGSDASLTFVGEQTDMIEFKCACGHLQQVAERHVGKERMCPNCGRLLKVPEESQRDIPAPSVSVSAPEWARESAQGSPWPWLGLVFLGAVLAIVVLVCVMSYVDRATDSDTSAESPAQASPAEAPPPDVEPEEEPPQEQPAPPGEMPGKASPAAEPAPNEEPQEEAPQDAPAPL